MSDPTRQPGKSENTAPHRNIQAPTNTHVPEPNVYSDDDTISLVDLLAVVVRYRRLVVGGTFVAGLIAIAFLYLFPILGLTDVTEASFTAETRIVVNRIPDDLREFIATDPAEILQALLRNPRIVGEVYRSYDPNPDPTRSRERYLSMIRRTVINEHLQISWSGSARQLTLSWTGPTPQEASSFLDDLLTAVGHEFELEIQRQLQTAENSLQRSLASATDTLEELILQTMERVTATTGTNVTSERIITGLQSDRGNTISAFVNLEITLERVQSIMNEPTRLYAVVGEPVVFEETGGGRAVRVVVTVLAAFFLTIFLSFVFQYANTVKSDPEEMEKLRSAWLRK